MSEVVVGVGAQSCGIEPLACGVSSNWVAGVITKVEDTQLVSGELENCYE